jgi:hypothetical protein
MIPVKLTHDEEMTCAAYALLRAYGSEGMNDYSVQKMNLFQDIARNGEAIGAENAVHKYFHRDIPFKPTVNTFKSKADVGWNLEVKHTPWKDGCLILRDRDRAEDVAVLVTGNSPNYYIVGWIPIGMARRPQRKRSDGSYWINPSDLNPIENLNRSIYAQVSQA